MLVTDFSFEHRGVKSLVVEGVTILSLGESSKMPTLTRMFDMGLIEDDLYWCHDLDAYELNPIIETELELDGFDLGLTDYGRKTIWQMGSMFFTKKAEDIIRAANAKIKPGRDHCNRMAHEETAMNALTQENTGNINNRIKRMNIRYNFGLRQIKLCYEKAIKPLKVLHFHPMSEVRGKVYPRLEKAMYGRNGIGKPLMTDRLIRIFKNYGYS